MQPFSSGSRPNIKYEQQSTLSDVTLEHEVVFIQEGMQFSAELQESASSELCFMLLCTLCSISDSKDKRA